MELDGNCRYLLVFPSEEEKHAIAGEIEKHVERTEFISVTNTAEAKSSIASDHPHIVVSKVAASRIDGYEILEYLKNHEKSKNVPLILVGEIPSKKLFVDELVSGRIQFSDDINNETKFSNCLKRL